MTRPGSVIPAEFFERDVVEVARSLIGHQLICRGRGGTIVEVEAYHEREAACHAHRGRTPRNDALFGPPGTAYVYFTYGMHWCFNVVCEPEGIAAAVLIRAIRPERGIEEMRAARAARAIPRDSELCSGPARLVQALGISSTDNGSWVAGPRADRTGAACPVILVGTVTGHEQPIRIGPRIGISKAEDLQWRFGTGDRRWLSRPF